MWGMQSTFTFSCIWPLPAWEMKFFWWLYRTCFIKAVLLALLQALRICILKPTFKTYKKGSIIKLELSLNHCVFYFCLACPASLAIEQMEFIKGPHFTLFPVSFLQFFLIVTRISTKLFQCLSEWLQKWAIVSLKNRFLVKRTISNTKRDIWMIFILPRTNKLSRVVWFLPTFRFSSVQPKNSVSKREKL